MKTYNFSNASVVVYNCPFFRIVEVRDLTGKKVHEIMTNQYGKKAAGVAMAEAIRFRHI